VARGKISLLKARLAGEEALENLMGGLLSHCLLCGACSEGCSSGAKGDELILAGRSLALKTGGLGKIRELLARDLLGRGPLVRVLWQSRSLFLKDVPPESGLHFRFPVASLLGDRWLPSPAAKPFLHSFKEPSAPRKGPRVALFVGCVANYLRPQSAAAAVRLLEDAGAQVVVPLSQVCCGKPAAGAGDENTARFLAARNLRFFPEEDFDFIVPFCSSCSGQLKEYGGLLGTDEAVRFSGKVVELSHLLASELNWRPHSCGGDDDKELRVFYHDPCHLRRKQGVYREPRQLLSNLPGVKLVGEDAAPVCCGHGGLFNLWHYDLSQAIFRDRAESLDPYKPDLVVTPCSGCWLQFEDGLRRLGLPIKAKPLVELLAEKGCSRETDTLR